MKSVRDDVHGFSDNTHVRRKVYRELYYDIVWPLCCLSFFDVWLLITPLVSSNLFDVANEGRQNRLEYI
jgi:hypothetical protein